MSIVALDGNPIIPLGSFIPAGQSTSWTTTNVTIDAANEANIMYGQIITDDGASHTIDTTGSSSLQWRTAAVTFGNAGTTFKVGLAAMDLATGPPGRAANVADVITLDVSKTMLGSGGGVTANAWQSHVPDAGTKTVANGDFLAFCTQMTARVTDSVIVSNAVSSVLPGRPSVTSFTGGSYAAVGSSIPNCLIVFSDGHRGWFNGGHVFTSFTSQTWNSGSAAVEFGNYLQFPFPMKIYGVYSNSFTQTADCDFVLYSDPLGTPFAEKTVSIDANAITSATARPSWFLFSSPYTAGASQPLAVIAKPGGSNVTLQYKTFNAAADQATDHCGTNGYAVSRASGAFAAVNSNKDRFALGLLVGAFGARNLPINAMDLVR